MITILTWKNTFKSVQTGIKWIGPVFTRIFIESGTDTTEKVSNAHSKSLYKNLVEINNEKRPY
ncbi:MAG: hypothetical protein ACXVHP_04310 [Methanobacterium sp.]